MLQIIHHTNIHMHNTRSIKLSGYFSPCRQSINKHNQTYTAIPTITIETASPNAAGSVARRSSDKPRPKSVHICSQASDNARMRAHLSHPTSPAPAQPHRPTSPSPSNLPLSPSAMQRPRSKSCTVVANQCADPVAAEPSSTSSSQQLAEMMVKFILASDNPDLRAALKRAIDSDPKMADCL